MRLCLWWAPEIAGLSSCFKEDRTIPEHPDTPGKILFKDLPPKTNMIIGNGIALGKIKQSLLSIIGDLHYFYYLVQNLIKTSFYELCAITGTGKGRTKSLFSAT